MNVQMTAGTEITKAKEDMEFSNQLVPFTDKNSQLPEQSSHRMLEDNQISEIRNGSPLPLSNVVSPMSPKSLSFGIATGTEFKPAKEEKSSNQLHVAPFTDKNPQQPGQSSRRMLEVASPIPNVAKSIGSNADSADALTVPPVDVSRAIGNYDSNVERPLMSQFKTDASLEKGDTAESYKEYQDAVQSLQSREQTFDFNCEQFNTLNLLGKSVHDKKGVLEIRKANWEVWKKVFRRKKKMVQEFLKDSLQKGSYSTDSLTSEIDRVLHMDLDPNAFPQGTDTAEHQKFVEIFCDDFTNKYHQLNGEHKGENLCKYAPQTEDYPFGRCVEINK